jgi:AraC-like DNA-binding protein
MPELALSTPLPHERRLASLCRALIDAPSLEIGIDQMATRAGMSRRSFTRLFRAQTGMSFTAWRQQACLLAALTRLDSGESITQVAMDLGYSQRQCVYRRIPSCIGCRTQSLSGIPRTHRSHQSGWLSEGTSCQIRIAWRKVIRLSKYCGKLSTLLTCLAVYRTCTRQRVTIPPAATTGRTHDLSDGLLDLYR